MQCPPEIAELVHDTLRIGILRIRSNGWSQNPERCAIEADHLHNLPALLNDYRPELLDYYLRVERMNFRAKSVSEDIVCFQPLWDALIQRTTNKQALAG